MFKKLSLFSFGIFAASVACNPPARAGLPLPSITVFGMLLDDYGWPYATDDYVEIYAQGTKILTKNLTSASGLTYNFLVRLPYDSGGQLGDYSPDVISPGDNVQINLVDNGTGLTVASTNFIANVPPGAVINFNSVSGADSLGDGLPDALRQIIWNAIGNGSPFDPSLVKASDDSDGDGVSNLNEFLAGTDPSNPDDVLKVTISPTANPAVAQLTFFSTPGKPYQVQIGQSTATGITWTVAPFANNPYSTATLTQAIGTGHFLSVFVSAADSTQLYRLVVNPLPRGGRLIP